MQDSHTFFPKDLYSSDLSVIRNIPFTRREVDVMACLLGARKTSKTAQFLSIDPRTVETHIRNITLKLECNTREGIIDFLEASDKLPFLRKHYFSLQIESAFEKSLKDVSKLTHNESAICILMSGNDQDFNLTLISQLKIHLKLVGVISFNVGAIIQEYGHLVYVLPTSLQVTPSSFVQIINQYPGDKVLLLSNEGQKKKNLPKELRGCEFISFAKHECYYFYFFNIIKKIFPNLKIDNVIAIFKEKYEQVRDVMKSEGLQFSPQIIKEKNNPFVDQIVSIVQTRKWLLALLFIGVISMVVLTYHGLPGNQQYSIVSATLTIPAETVFLDRPELLLKIEEDFNKTDSIQTVALMGMGGAGKTTLARQYARQQKSKTIWEINAETQETLKHSFEKLAQHLARTEEDKKTLRGIQEIKSPTEREEQTMLFVQRHLKSQSEWLLIYDNVENFSDIQKYFPQNVKLWGQGRVILTTRNTNIQNNSHVNRSITLGELTLSEKLNLFTKIMKHGAPHPLIENKRETITFLEGIPPFPLDISVAAYYLKATNTPYRKYLEILENYNNKLANIQETLLKEEGSYLKTRYSIVVLSLEHMLKIHKDFGELLLFMGLLNSQNIPKDLLNSHKNDAVVDSLIYYLKKYSLLTNNFSDAVTEQNFSIHRSTQSIILAYLTKKLNLLENNKILKSICDTFVNYTADAIEKKDFLKMKFLLSHCIVLLNHKNLLTDLMKTSISCELGGLYCHQHSYMKSKEILKNGLEFLDKKRDQNLYAHILIYLGRLYNMWGNYKKSKALFEKSIAIYKKYSKNSKDLPKVLAYLGNMHRKTGDYKKAQILLEKSLVLYQSHSPQKRVLIPWINLGILYQDLGQYEKAKNLYGEILKIYKQYSPENYVGIAEILTRLGKIYRDLGQYEKAINLFKQTAKIYQQDIFDHKHSIAGPLAHLSSVYIELKNYDKAKKLLDTSLMINKKEGSENSAYVAVVLEYLGNTHAGLKNYQAAKYFLQKKLTVYENQYGKTHLKTAYVLRDLGRVYLLETDFEMAKKFLDNALKIFQRDKHPEIYTCLESFSDLYLKKSVQAANKKDIQQANLFKNRAIDYLRNALDVLKITFPADSPHIGRIQLKFRKLQE